MKLVIFGGTTGFGKTEFIKKFREISLKRHDYSLDDNGAEGFIKLIKFEDELLKIDKSENIDTFLKKHSSKEKAKAVEHTFQRISKIISSAPPNYLFLNIHLSYYKESGFFPPFSSTNFQAIAKGVAPRDIRMITLIDDVFVIWQTLREKAKDFPNSELRLREIISWRSLETLMAESVAQTLTTDEAVEAYLVAVRHPIDTLYNLIFHSTVKIGYLSYPITNTRNHPDRVSQINSFRKDAHKIASEAKAVLFDPTTIDELVLTQAADLERGISGKNGRRNRKKEVRKKDDLVPVQKQMRWPLEDNGLLGSNPSRTIKIPLYEIEEVEGDISNNITARDYKLIDVSRVVAAYRPYWGGPSTGVRAELTYATQTGKITIAYDPDSSSKAKNRPFGLNVPVESNLKTYMTKIRDYLGKS